MSTPQIPTAKPDARTITSMEVSDAANGKPLGRFGCKVISRPVSEGRAKAEQENASA